MYLKHNTCMIQVYVSARMDVRDWLPPGRNIDCVEQRLGCGQRARQTAAPGGDRKCQEGCSVDHLCTCVNKHLFIAWNISILKQPSENHEVLVLFVNVTHFTRQYSWSARWFHWWRSLPANAVTWVPSSGSMWWKERTYSLQKVVLSPQRLCDHLILHARVHARTHKSKYAIKINNNW